MSNYLSIKAEEMAQKLKNIIEIGWPRKFVEL